MKPKSYPTSVRGKEELFILDFLLNQDGKLKAAAVSSIPDYIKDELSSNALSRGLYSTNLTECIYWIVHDLFAYPKTCISCGSPIKKFHSFSRGYPHTRCSTKCSNTDSRVIKKKQDTSLEKYGTLYPSQSYAVKLKTSRTISERVSGTKNVQHGLMEIFEYVGSLVPKETILLNSNPGKEQPNIVIEGKKVAFDFNNLLSHSFSKKESKEEKMMHADKAKAFLEKGIKLVQIFEHEWEEKKEIVKNRIKSILGNDERIFARKCEVREISVAESNEFLSKYHIQGKCIANVKIGLFHDGDLVAVMTLSTPRFSKKYQWEIIRYCSKMTVVGGASRAFKYFINKYDPDNVMTYADLRWSDGNLYRQLGLTFIGISNPNYFYFKGDKRFPRYAFQKGRMEKHLERFDPLKTEHENAFANGYRRCWDAGNLMFTWSKN